MQNENANAEVITIPRNLAETVKWKPNNHRERELAIREHYLRGAENYLIVGCLLKQSKNAADWRRDGIANGFFEWVEKELKISRSNAQRMIVIWEAVKPFISKHRNLVLSIDFAKLAEIAWIIKGADEQKALEWLHMAKENTVKDLKENIKESKGLPTKDTCANHEWEQWVKCIKCGKFEKA